MRVPFANRLTRSGRANDEAETGQVVDLNEPVILFPAEHVSPHHEIEQARWKKPAVLVTSTAIVSVLGAGAGILILRGAGEGRSSAANDGPFTVELSASALPDGDLRIAPTARDSVPNAEPGESVPTASREQEIGPPVALRTDRPSAESIRAAPIVAVPPAREPVPVSTPRPGLEGRVEPGNAAQSGAESRSVAPADTLPSEQPRVDTNPAVDEVVTTQPARPNPEIVTLDTVAAVQVPVSDSDVGSSGVTAAPAPGVPEPPPDLDSMASPADPAVARSALLAGVGRLIDAINAKDGEERVRPLLLDPVSQREVFRFVRDDKPTASVGTVDEVQFDDDEATMIVRVGFSWRGSFGVEERETRRFLAIARRDGREWRFAGLRLTGDLP